MNRVLTINDFALELNEYVKANFKYKDTRIHIELGTINIRRSSVRLHLRFMIEWEKKQNVFVFAQLGFQRERKGEGRKILTFISQCADKYGFEYIGIETANDKAIGFGKRMGFDIYEYPMGGFKQTHLIISTEKLNSVLNSK